MNTIRKKDIPKIDLHSHYLPKSYKEALLSYCEEKPDGFPTPVWTPEEHLKVMDHLGIKTSMLSLSAPHINFGDKMLTKALARDANECGAQLVKKYPGRFGLFASLPLPDIENSIAEIQYAKEVLHADGFALPTNTRGVYLGNACLDPILEVLNKYKAVIVLHPNKPGSVPADVVEELPAPLMEYFFDTTRTVVNMIGKGTFQRFSAIKFIIPHAGAFLPVLADRLASALQMMPSIFGGQAANVNIDICSELKGLYYDLAGACLPKQLANLMQIADTDHFLYGSDYPYTSLPACMALKDALNKTEMLTDKQRQCIYSENALQLFPGLKKD